MDLQTEGQLWGRGWHGCPAVAKTTWDWRPRFFLSFFNLFILYRTLQQSVCHPCRAAGDRLVFSASVRGECVCCCRSEPRPRVSSSPGVPCLAGQFSGAGGSPGDLVKNREFGLCGPRSSAGGRGGGLPVEGAGGCSSPASSGPSCVRARGAGVWGSPGGFRQKGGEGRLRRLEGQAEARRFGLETLEMDASTTEAGA